MTLTNFDKIDISSNHEKFEDFEKESLRNKIRDLYDSLLRRPFYKFYYHNFFKKQNYKIDYTIPDKGLSPFKKLEKINNYKKIKDSKILNVGCGNAFTYHHLFKFKPKSIYGIDVLNYRRSWQNVIDYVKKKKVSTEIKFKMMDIADLDTSLNFDIIISEAVFEHCKDFEKIANILFNVLDKNGLIYSSYGPLWYTYGGDHFSGRDNNENGYNHLLLDSEEYKKYFNKNVGNLEYELSDDGGGGGILVENDLFSKLSGNEYMNIFKKVGFESLETIAELDPTALKILKYNKKLKYSLIEKNLPVNFEDFYLKTQTVYLKKY